MALVSVIVPVYNVQNDVEKCINSILMQDFHDFELLIINDGSQDKSGEICKAFKDRRIRYFEKPNGGLASARNYGLERARGNYFCCVDSDDFLDSGFLSFCVEKIQQSDADIVLCGYFMENGKSISEIKASSGFYCGKEINSRMIELKSKNLIDPAWNKLYRTEFVKLSAVKFPEGEIYEDTDFNLRILKYNPKIYAADKCFYHYVLHMGSITRRYNPQKISTIKRRALLLKEITEGIDAYCDYYYIKSVFSAIIDMFMCFKKTDIIDAIRREIFETRFQAASKNAEASGRNAKLVIAAAQSGNPYYVYLFCKAIYILKFKFQKLFLKVRE